MLLRLAIAVVVFLAVAGVLFLWRRPPRRLACASLSGVGIIGPAIVQFSAPTCAPCRAAKPKLVEAAREARVEFAQIDVDEQPDVAKRFGIRTVPTIVVTGQAGEILRVWTKVPANGEVTELARRAVGS